MLQKPIGFYLGENVAQDRLNLIASINMAFASDPPARIWLELEHCLGQDISYLYSLRRKISRQHGMMTARDANAKRASEREIENALIAMQDSVSASFHKISSLLGWLSRILSQYHQLISTMISEESERWFHGKKVAHLSFLISDLQKIQQGVMTLSGHLQQMDSLAFGISPVHEDNDASAGYRALNLRLINEENQRVIDLVQKQMADINLLSGSVDEAKLSKIVHHYQKKAEPLMQPICKVLSNLHKGFSNVSANLSQAVWKAERDLEKEEPIQ